MFLAVLLHEYDDQVCEFEKMKRATNELGIPEMFKLLLDYSQSKALEPKIRSN